MDAKLFDAKKKLKESEQKFQVLFNNSTSGIAYHEVVYDINGKPINYVITDVNLEYEKILSLRRNDVINRKATDVYQLENPPYIDIYAKVADTQESVSFETYFPPMDAHFKISVLSPKKGEFITVFDNITDRKIAEEAIKSEKEKLQAFMDGLTSTGIGMDIVSKDYEVLFQNKILRERFGGLIDETCYKKYMELEEPCDFCPMIKAINNNTVESVELTGADGRAYQLISAPIPNSDGTIDKAAEIVVDITDRKLSEKDLKESEEKYRLISENANDLISVLNDKYEYEYINEEAHIKLLGYSENDIMGKNAWNFVHPEDSKRMLSSRNLSTGGFRELEGFDKEELRVRHKNGQYIWIEYTSKVFVDEQEKPKVILISRDISERKNAEQRVKEKNLELLALNRIIALGNESQSLQEFLERSYDQVLELVGFDRGGVYLYNPRTQHNKLVLHKNVHPDFITAVEDVDVSEGLFSKIFDKNKPFYIEDFSEFIEGSKELGVYSAAIVPLRSKEEYVGSLNVGSPVQQVLSQNELELLVGIGKQMGIIIQKFESEILLKESEEKFRRIAEQSLMGIIILQDDVIKYENQRAADIFGYTVEEASSWKPNEFLKTISPDFSDIVIEQVKKKQKASEDVIAHYEFKGLTKTGEEIWIENYSRSINYNGKPADFVTLIDITEKKKVEQLIIEENKKLLELSEMRQDLITRITHELKTPITSIFGASQALLEIHNKDMNDKILEFVEIINRGGIRLISLVENILDVSRLESKKIELRCQEENIVDIIRESVTDLMYFAEARKLHLNLNLPDELFLNIDRIKIGQVITNIFSNAINNTLPGGKVSIGIHETSEHVDIIIKDTGVGITIEEKKKLFEKFGKIERFGKGYDVHIEGSGLGLFISKEFVKLHGGQILVESGGRNQGATFTVRLNRNS